MRQRKNYRTGGPIDKDAVSKFEKEKLKAVQLDLQSKGLYKGKIDGVYGNVTAQAIDLYNTKNTYPVAWDNHEYLGPKPEGMLGKPEVSKQYNTPFNRRALKIANAVTKIDNGYLGDNAVIPEVLQNLPFLQSQLDKLTEFKNKRDVRGNMSPEEQQYRDDLYTKVAPYGYAINSAVQQLQGTTKRAIDTESPELEDLWSIYTNSTQRTPQAIKKSVYKPSKASDPSTNYYDAEKFNNVIGDDVVKRMLGKNNPKVFQGGNEAYATLGNVMLSKGADDKGEYISYYDKFDLDPTGGLVDINTHFNPAEIYGRVYKEDLRKKYTNSDFDNQWNNTKFDAPGVGESYTIERQERIDAARKKATGGYLQDTTMRKTRRYQNGGPIDPFYPFELSPIKKFADKISATPANISRTTKKSNYSNNTITLKEEDINGSGLDRIYLEELTHAWQDANGLLSPTRKVVDGIKNLGSKSKEYSDLSSIEGEAHRKIYPILASQFANGEDPNIGYIPETQTFFNSNSDTYTLTDGGLARVIRNDAGYPVQIQNLGRNVDGKYAQRNNEFTAKDREALLYEYGIDVNNQKTSYANGGSLQNNQMKKTRRYAGGGQMPIGGDPYAMAAQYVTQIAGDYQSAFNYNPTVGAEKSNKDYAKEIAMSVATKGIIGAVPAILRMNKDKNTIVSGSPGTYQQGGPIQVRPTNNRGSRPNTYVPNLGTPITQASTNPLQNILVPGLIPEQPTNPLLAMTTGNLGGTSKSKSKDRFRERANGGSLDDAQLSNNSFQVKDDPNVTDGKHYPEFNANLDHNEVVDSNAKFVFSDDLKLGKKSFAELAKPLYKKLGDLETRKDPITQATTEQLNKQINNLAMTQEELATALGLRENQGMGRAKGGPLPWADFNVAEFQQWYNSLPGATKIAADGKWGKQTEAAYNTAAQDYMRLKGKNVVSSIGGMSTLTPDGTSYIDVNPTNGVLLPSSISEPRPIPNKPIYVDTPDGPVDISGLESRDPRQETMKDRERRVMLPDGTQYNPSVDPMSADRTMNMNVPSSPLPTDTMPQFNIGDIMQGIEVGSKFFNIGQGAEKERQLLNTTPVTRTGYDAQPLLQQNQRNYQNAVNSIGTSSANTRRALSNSMYASKLNADNQVLTNYQNMNNEATVNYENRLSQQRQGNIASAFRTNDMNAANRGQYDQAQQNAFTSLGNFGQAMNRRKMSADMLKLLKAQYPEVYNNVMGGIN